jgi:putative mRNA 3-end processing factor
MSELLSLRPEGLYCEAGDFYIDPWRPVDRAVITHAHADHARAGHSHYLAAQEGAGVLRARLGTISLQTLAWGESVMHHGVRVSLHPAGHVLGSAQIRVEAQGEVWVVSGDYKVQPDRTCTPFEPVRCDVFVTESTFGLPIYRWAPEAEVLGQINAWWQANAQAGRSSLLLAYSFGKAQRILAGLDSSIGPIVCHGALEPINAVYRDAGVHLPSTLRLTELESPSSLPQALVLAPPSVAGSSWLKRLVQPSQAFASGWMAVRGLRRRRVLDRGFVLSDHADWPGLHQAIDATRATRVLVTHGDVPVMVRALRERGLDASSLRTEFGTEREDG